jgi:thiol-disulfide isomerase/thioredoxin
VTDLLTLAAVLAATAGLAVWWRARDGRVVEVGDTARLDAGQLADLGAPPGGILLLEFTAPGCVPCVATARILSEVVGDRTDVAVFQADVGEHLDLARAHGILRAPTTLVVDAEGRVRHRISGVPEPDAVADLLDPPGVTRRVA